VLQPTGSWLSLIEGPISQPIRARSSGKICMNGVKAFFDTNVLLYMYGGDSEKRARVKELFRQYAKRGSMLLSTQVVQEFYSAGSQKLGIPRAELREAVAALLDCPLVIVGPSEIRSAMENEERYQISFWDGLLLAAAGSGGSEHPFHGGLERRTTIWKCVGA
jgi:predicted nucleic acid-binding protein